MLERYLDQLLFEMREAAAFQPFPSIEDRAAWERLSDDCRRQLSREAERQIKEAIPALCASDYMRFQRKGHRSAYSMPYLSRRDMLSALVMGMAVRPDEQMEMRIADLIWAIAEESSWVLPPNSPLAIGENSLPLPDIYEPLVDSAAANTALDLCMTAQLMGERLYDITPQLLQRIEYEIERRIIEPFLAARDMDWMCGSKSDAAVCLRGVMMSFLTFEQDGRRRWQCMRKAWGILDRLLMALPQDGSIPGGVSEWLETVGPVMDCLNMVRTATNNRIDVRREMQIQLMCHYPVLCHIAQGWFVNPGAQSMRPELSGPAMYRIGMAVRDGALCDLGAFLFRMQGEGQKEPLLLHRCQNAMLRSRLEQEKGTPPFRCQGYLNAQELMVARMREDDERGLALAVHGGSNGQVGGHPDVGDIILFAHGQPVLVDAGWPDDTSFHSIPTVGSFEQLTGAMRRAEDVDCQLEEEYAMLSMNLAGLYPPEAHIMNWQRSAVYNRTDGTVQLIDVFDLNAFETVHFHFMTPCKPVLGEKFAQLGPVRLRWEEGLTAECETIELKNEPWKSLWNGSLCRLTLTTAEPVDGGEFTFTLNALRTFG